MLILDVKTRWNSTYEMIERALKMRKVVDLLTSCEADLKEFALHNEDWEILQEVLDFLQIFKDTSTFLCAERYPTIQYVVPVYNYLLEKIKDCMKSKGTHYMIPAMKLAYEKISGYYDLTGTGQKSPLSEIYATSILLDPTLKFQFFKDRNWAPSVMKSIRDKVRNIYLARAGEQNVPDSEDRNDQENSSPLITELYKKRKLEKRNEFDQYLAMPVVPYENNGSSCKKLAWWKANQSQFPVMAGIARDFLSVPATSCPSERAFSSAKHLIGVRYRLEEETIQKCMCLKEWMRANI